MDTKSNGKKSKGKNVKQAAKAPAADAPKAELLPAHPDVKDYSNLPVNERAAFMCKDRIENASKNASTAFYDISMGLLEAYENDYARIWGFTNFSDYVEGSLDMKYRSAYYLVEIGKIVRKFNIDRGQIERIGWTKMKEIAGYISAKPEEAGHYLALAESMSVSNLKEALGSEAKITEGSDARPAIMRLSLKLEGDSANMVNDGLALAYGDIGKEDVNLALSHIIGEWLVARGASPKASTLEDWQSYLEKVYGVKLVKAEEADAIDALLAGGETQAGEDDTALEELLNSTESELDGLVS
jgi:hypothetical protein